jgi:pimeloyl-ACP methyl ester carboxylesterase
MSIQPVALQDDEFDLKLTSGRVRARRVGSPDASLVLCVHGLSANMRGFDQIVKKLAQQDRQLVALDLRGRGRSEVTRAGTFGIAAHCRDLLEVATLLGSDRFDLVGWSMGALIGICVANRAPERLRRLVMIDAAGQIDPGTSAAILKGLDRLDLKVEAASTYVEAIRSAGVITPWTPFWDRYFEYELGPDGEGFKATSSKSACLEDAADLAMADWPASWKSLSMPTLLLRCLSPIAGGFTVPEAVLSALRLAVPQIRLVESDSNHYTVMNDDDASSAIKEFLNGPP